VLYDSGVSYDAPWVIQRGRTEHPPQLVEHPAHWVEGVHRWHFTVDTFAGRTENQRTSPACLLAALSIHQHFTICPLFLKSHQEEPACRVASPLVTESFEGQGAHLGGREAQDAVG